MSNSKRILPFIAVLVLAVIACGLLPVPSAATPTGLPIVPVTPVVSPAPTSAAARSLTVCIGQEPNTLYPFGELNTGARSVLAAVYDAPLNMINYKYQAGVLVQLPTLENGDAQIATKKVEIGAEIVNADGDVVKLEQGTKVRPAKCRVDDCVITYDGKSPLEMDQMTVSFKMRSDLIWSDGTPVTSDDSIYAYSLASQPDSPSAYLVARTENYEAADASSVQWWGKPGYIDSSYVTNFFTPAPKHLWSKFPPEKMPQIDIASRSPVGWGAYMIDQWAAGDHISLKKNPYYYRSADGLPKFDTLTFRFISDPNVALSELVARRCDLLDPSIRLDNYVGLLLEMQKAEQAQVFVTPSMTIEWLGLGITPASYDDGYKVGTQVDREDIFGDPHTRQGIVYCLDRKSVVDNVLFGLTTIPSTYIPVEHPLYDPNNKVLPYDPATGISLLEQAGWKDTDKNPATPLEAVEVKNVKPGTLLELNYYTTTAAQRRQVADILAHSLAKCGIGLNVQYFSQNDLYAPGPGGPLFGRKFDLIEYAMGVDGIQPPCQWFASWEIPNAQNSWIGTNLTGYKNPDYDAACRATSSSLPDEKGYADAYHKTESLFADDLPSVPLYYRLQIAAARPDLCNFNLDPTANPLWNIANFDMGEACKK